ncbi:DEAD/DEAH box helicase [Gramella sp. AN32]|uniref:DEAD/DEAH box helicase n=1 Tax=Christiangramia antarctica TaxID=2058158 RepID=A0ABW5XA54_9FLAO|nr:DEAD/DEAH box helicase [Gramella sp. AN32]MCM4155817.1 ATP-dependent RNA helicase RhlE [Gramella sp. AN32]
MSFTSLGLSAPLLKAVSKKGYTTPSPIQEKAIPLILERKDILASAQTGTGKTAGFTLPMLQILAEGQTLRKRPVRALVLTPTRELAAQVYEDVKDYGVFLDLKANVIFGGVNATRQIRSLQQGVDIVVATPGRLLDLHNQKALSLANVEILVLDEADRMLDMGFLRDIRKILALMPVKRQNLLFSATFSKEIKQLANTFLHHPVLVEATPEVTTAEKVNQKFYKTDKSRKTDLTVKLISEGNWEQVLVFTRTKHGANRLSQKLEKNGITSAAIHGNKSQGARTKALAGFKKGNVRVLCATDIAARGLDIPLLPHVINFELPNVPEDYVHRIGRTGRAGASGEAISLVSVDENDYVKAIEKLLGETLTKEVIVGFEPTESLQEVLETKAHNKKQQNAGRNARSSRNSRNSKSGSGRRNRN